MTSRRAKTLALGLVLAAVFAAGTSSAWAGPATTGRELAAPSRKGGSYSARLVAPARATGRPAGGPLRARLGTSTTWSHHSQALLVLGSRTVKARQWLKVLLPVRPSGSFGWIPRNRVVLRHSNLWVEIRKKNRWLLAFWKGRRIRRYRIVIGTRATPTPAGLAAVYERNRQPDPNEFLGPWSLPLTAFSPTLKSFGGGPGRVAIHGRGGQSYLDPLGSAASHGCIRVSNRGVRWMALHAGPGTPVMIRN